MQLVNPCPGEGLVELAIRCEALCICPKDDGVRKGPLVPYAGVYDHEGKSLNFVGDIYFNFRRIEQHPAALEAFATATYHRLRARGLLSGFTTICGIPQGGRTFGQELARIAEKRFVYADKEPIETMPGQKQKYAWNLSQFDFESGERVAMVEDVFNNFQNTNNTLEAIARTRARVVLLAGALNRSPYHDLVYIPQTGTFASNELPVVAAIHEPYPEYRQDDPAVASDVAAGNIEWKVKDNWSKLSKAMLLPA